MKKDHWQKEITVTYPREQRDLYKHDDPCCIYEQWPGRVGIHKAGRNFPAMVAKKHFMDKGYSVLKQYFLMRCPRQREYNEGFAMLCKIFGEPAVRQLIKNALPLKGGDPDLFVYKPDLTEKFFVEVKENDELTSNQLQLFPLIVKHLCPVYVVRVKPQ